MTPDKTIVVVNSTGRQGASLVRVASAVGFRVRAQLRSRDGLVARELESLRGVELIEGSLEDSALVSRLFPGAQLAFINTTSWGDEVAIGRSLADAAKKAGIQHYVYSSMPDHSVHHKEWPALPHWSKKFMVENYVRQIGLPATFVYAGIYNNNFTSLPYPLFCMELQSDGSFLWRAPFNPEIPLPWLDAEHDIGPAVLQLLKDGPRKWLGHRFDLSRASPRPPSIADLQSTNSVALAFELLTPLQVCAAFSRALQRRVAYQRSPIEIKVSIPAGYREQLDQLEVLFGIHDAPYFAPDLTAPDEAMQLWEGFRGIEEYAREVFPVEERLNRRRWMDEPEDDEPETIVNGVR